MASSRLNFGIGNQGTTSLSTPQVRNPLNIGNNPVIPMPMGGGSQNLDITSANPALAGNLAGDPVASSGINSGNLNFTPGVVQIPSSNNNNQSSQQRQSQEGLQFIQLNQNSATNDYQVPSYLRDEVEQDVLTMEYS